MTSKAEGLEKLKRIRFKLMERLNFKLSFIVLHSLINDFKEEKGVNNKKLENIHLWNDIGIHKTQK